MLHIKTSSFWLASTLISLLLSLWLIQLWSEMNHYEVNPQQLTNTSDVIDYLRANEPTFSALNHPTIQVHTGVFIQSLQFINSSDVDISGYLWQRFDAGELDALHRAGLHEGVIFPEEVSSGSDNQPVEIYRLKEGESDIIGWYFDTTVRQPFDYDNYPFDHKTVWLRLWPKDFYAHVILVPDFDAYDATGMEDIFGIEEQIVLGTWERENTYFDYHHSNYTTDFGMKHFVGKQGFPELQYNIVIKRKFENAFIVNLLPLFLVASLLFAALLTVSHKKQHSQRLGFNATGFINTSSALFFVVMLAHIQLREKFEATSIVYMEYFYILMYCVLIITTANVYLFSIKIKLLSPVIDYRDNLLPKVIFWPSILAAMVAISLWANI
jgi:hypothetical protein